MRLYRLEKELQFQNRFTSQIQGLNRVPVQEAQVGDIVWISGIEGITIGDTICAVEQPEALPFVKISEPTR